MKPQPYRSDKGIPEINLAREEKKIIKYLVRIVIKLKNETVVSILFFRLLILPSEVTFLGHGKTGESQGLFMG